MNLVIVSHKECWKDINSPTGFSTIGGFPFQMEAISQLFTQTKLIIALKTLPSPPE